MWLSMKVSIKFHNFNPVLDRISQLTSHKQSFPRHFARTAPGFFKSECATMPAQLAFGAHFSHQTRLCSLGLPTDSITSAVYSVKCKTCSGEYVGETFRALRVRKKEHCDAIRLGQSSKSAIAEHWSMIEKQEFFQTRSEHWKTWRSEDVSLIYSIISSKNTSRERMWSHAWHRHCFVDMYTAAHLWAPQLRRVELICGPRLHVHIVHCQECVCMQNWS